MITEYEQQLSDFATKAQRLLVMTFENFCDSTKKLNRQKDENVFQLQLGKFLATLRQQLESIAIESIKKNKALKNADLFNKILTDQIRASLSEFRRKSRLV